MQEPTFKTVAFGACAGAVVVLAIGATAGALVPVAMSTFGTVVSGVGTIHAAGGVAAVLQWIAVTFFTPSLVAAGALIGAAVTSGVSMVRQKRKVA